MDQKFDMMFLRHDAAAACLAHNQEVEGASPSAASKFLMGV